MNRWISYGLVAVYLCAIVIANMTTAAWGPTWSVYNAFILVGLVLTTRDRLNDLWGKHRLRNMALLIAAGSGISFAAAHVFTGSAPPDVVAKIALASAVAFAVAESFDFATYTLLHKRPWLERSNTSNVVGAIFDSTVFVTIAFGWNWQIIVAQVGAKVAGGYVWSLVMRHVKARNEPEVA